MSLDVYLKNSELTHTKCICDRCGNEHNYNYHELIYTANITHNLGKMASKADIYQHLWRHEELGITKAKELIEPLTAAIQDMGNRPEYYKQFNDENGWGMYEHFIPWLKRYLDACVKYPDSIISVSR